MEVVATFLFDGDCGFCSACARLIRRRIPTTARVLPWQRADLDRLGLTAGQCDAAVQWDGDGDGDGGGHAAGPVAIGRLLQDAGSFWRPLGWLLVHPPVRFVSWPVYHWLSRNRHHMPGGTPTCALPASDR
jgi:predicted DCC family thiol-disulfide oxidoreductase YuxK